MHPYNMSCAESYTSRETILCFSEKKSVSKTVSSPVRMFALNCLKEVMTAVFTEKVLRFVWTCLMEGKKNKYA